jgi:hypothetical protein
VQILQAHIALEKLKASDATVVSATLRRLYQQVLNMLQNVPSHHPNIKNFHKSDFKRTEIGDLPLTTHCP